MNDETRRRKFPFQYVKFVFSLCISNVADAKIITAESLVNRGKRMFLMVSA